MHDVNHSINIQIFNPTYTVLVEGITIVTSFTLLAVETFRVEQTLETFSRLIVTVADIVGVNVAITVASVTGSIDLRWVAEVIFITSSTVWSCREKTVRGIQTHVV
jgi:hypothetical protein